MATYASPPLPARRWDIAVGGAAILLAASYFTWAALGAYLAQSRASTSFVPVIATVLRSSVQTSGTATTSHGETYAPLVVYRYRLNGTTYESDRYFYVGEGWRDAAAARAAAERYPVGASAQAFVDIVDPSKAVLDRTAPTLGILLFLLPFSAVGLGAMAYGLRARRALVAKP